MGGEVEVNGVTPVMGQHYRHKNNKRKLTCPQYQKICCSYLLNVVLTETCANSAKVAFPDAHALRHRRLRDLNTQ